MCLASPRLVACLRYVSLSLPSASDCCDEGPSVASWCARRAAPRSSRSTTPCTRTRSWSGRALEGSSRGHGHGAELVFEVDLIDHDRWHGWSVVARGSGVVVHDAQDAGVGRPPVRPWAAGDRTSELRLAWTELTGRQVGAAWDAESAMYSRRPLP